MYDDAKETPTPLDAIHLDTTQTSYSKPALDSEATTRYSRDTNSQGDLRQLQEHIQHLQERLS